MKNNNPCPYSPSCFKCPLSDCKVDGRMHYNPMPHEHDTGELTVSRGRDMYTDEMIAFIRKYSYLTEKKLADEFNRKFHTHKSRAAIGHKRRKLEGATA